MLKDYQKDLLTSLYATLGVIGTFVVGLFGFIGWLQVRFGKERLDSIEQSLNGRITQTMSTAISEIGKSVAVKFDNASKKSIAENEKIKSNISDSINRYNDKINSKIWAVEYDLFELRLDLEEVDSIYIRTARDFCQHILSSSRGYEWKVHEIFGEIIKRLDSGSTIDVMDMTEWVSFINNLPDDYRIHREKIHRHLEKAT